MTRTDLYTKSISKIISKEEAINMISVLDYDECIYCLNNLKGVPTWMFESLINRAKSIKGMTYELVIASLQCAVN
jgi:hypothetical protein